MKRLMRLTILSLAFFLIASCSRITHTEPVLSSAVNDYQWQEQTPISDTQPITALPWWQAFKDPVLTNLLMEAIEHSPDMAIAKARVNQARASTSSTIADFLPNITGSANATRSETSSTLTNRPTLRPISNNFRAGFDASWEIDIFGTEPALRAAKHTEAQAQALYNQSLVTLTSEVALTYFTIRQLQARIDLVEKQITSQQDTVALTVALNKAGKTSESDTAQARALLATTKASLPPLNQQLRQTEYALDILTGSLPGSHTQMLIEKQSFHLPSDELILATPIDVIEHRPDVQAAKHQVQVDAALKDVAFSQFFPKLSLSALLGSETGSASRLFADPSRTWSLSSGLGMPIFDFGRIRSQMKKADAIAQESMAQFEKTVLLSLKEVESALAAFSSEHEHYQDLTRATKASSLSLKLATERYKNGLSSYLNVLDAQKTLYSAEEAQTLSAYEISIALVLLNKALGGTDLANLYKEDKPIAN